MLDRTRSRLKDQDWTFTRNENGNYSNEHAMLALLMDLRDELKKLNRLLHCSNFTDMPHTLRRIALNTNKPKRKRK